MPGDSKQTTKSVSTPSKIVQPHLESFFAGAGNAFGSGAPVLGPESAATQQARGLFSNIATATPQLTPEFSSALDTQSGKLTDDIARAFGMGGRGGPNAALSGAITDQVGNLRTSAIANELARQQGLQLGGIDRLAQAGQRQDARGDIERPFGRLGVFQSLLSSAPLAGGTNMQTQTQSGGSLLGDIFGTALSVAPTIAGLPPIFGAAGGLFGRRSGGDPITGDRRFFP